MFPLWLTEIADERTAARRGLLRANGAVSPLDQETDGNNKGGGGGGGGRGTFTIEHKNESAKEGERD